MSFSSLLAKIKNKPQDSDIEHTIQHSGTKSTNHPQYGSKPSTAKRSSNNNITISRKVDPAVQRLKELRKKENEEKEALLKAKAKERNTKPATSTRRARSAPATKPTHIVPNLSHSSTNLHSKDIRRSSSPAKRLSFKELMEEAKGKTKSLSDSSKVESVPETFASKSHHKGYQRKSTAPISKRPINPVKSYNNNMTSATVKNAIPIPKGPKPIAQPSARLRAKLEERRKNSNINRYRSKSSTKEDYERVGRDRSKGSHRSNSYSDDSDEEEEDDFIVYDEEEETPEAPKDIGYDREEIWKMFNKGRSKSSYRDYDDDLSDMEATGSEILQEEDRAAKRARREEIEEQEKERRRVEEKRRKLGKR